MDALIGLAPFAIVALACPLMMIFMMRGMHGGHDDQSGRSCHTTPADADRRDAPSEATAARLQAMERQVASLRDEVSRRNARSSGSTATVTPDTGLGADRR